MKKNNEFIILEPINLRKAMKHLELGNGLSYKDIKESVQKKQPIEFLAKEKQINLDDPVIRSYALENQTFILPLNLNKQFFVKALATMPTNTDNEKWDYITFLTYFSDGQIVFQTLKNDWFLVTINF